MLSFSTGEFHAILDENILDEVRQWITKYINMNPCFMRQAVLMLFFPVISGKNLDWKAAG